MWPSACAEVVEDQDPPTAAGGENSASESPSIAHRAASEPASEPDSYAIGGAIDEQLSADLAQRCRASSSSRRENIARSCLSSSSALLEPKLRAPLTQRAKIVRSLSVALLAPMLIQRSCQKALYGISELLLRFLQAPRVRKSLHICAWPRKLKQILQITHLEKIIGLRCIRRRRSIPILPTAR